MLEDFVGEKGELYVRMWMTAGSNVRHRYFNWAAFLIPFSWCFYRKMFRNGFVMLLVCALSLLTAGVLAVSFLRPQVDEFLTIHTVMENANLLSASSLKEADALYADCLRQTIYQTVHFGIVFLMIALLPNIIFSCLADTAYLHHAQTKIRQAAFWYHDDETKISALGGTSCFFLCLSIPAFLAILYLGYLLLQSFSFCFA